MFSVVGDRDTQTIIAQCTPRGSGALALLRLSGDNAVAIANNLSKLVGNKKLIDGATHTIHYGSVVTQKHTTIDHVLFLLMRAPHTFTGQDTVEITCHNNPFIIEQIIGQAVAHGARLAQEGEFTQRAYLHDKLDLVQAEAINELINANTQQALKQSLAQLDGSFSAWVVQLEQQLYKALALCEASFEFIDEDISFGPQIKELLQHVLVQIASIKNTFDQQQQIRNGVRIAIVGSVNAGKSSLFNALLSKERAIVTNIAGTTRDALEAGLYRNGNYWTLIDTAGLRQTNDIIEQEGIKRSHQEAATADIVLLVFDGSRTLTTQETTVYQKLFAQYHHKIIVIKSKTDLPQKPLPSFMSKALPFSNKKPTCTKLEKHIEQKISTLFAQADSSFLLNQRQFNLLLAVEQKINTILPTLDQPIEYELLAIHLKDTLELLAELTGRTISERGMDAVFREFCVGK